MNSVESVWKIVTCSTPLDAISATSSGQISSCRRMYSSRPPGFSRNVNPARTFPIASLPRVTDSIRRGEYEVGGSPADHDRRRVGVDADDRRHDRRIGDAQA